MIVDLVEQGRIQGVVEDGVTAFKGVPYAAPPTGGNRWAPPIGDRIAAILDGHASSLVHG